jgi:hypothetical protein
MQNNENLIKYESKGNIFYYFFTVSFAKRVGNKTFKISNKKLKAYQFDSET